MKKKKAKLKKEPKLPYVRFNRNVVITKVQRIADTKKQKIDASIVSRVASLVLDEVESVLNDATGFHMTINVDAPGIHLGCPKG